MKKFVIVASVVAMLGVTQVSAANNGASGTAVGIQFGSPGNVALSLRFSQLAIGAGWKLGDNGYLVLDIDYWLLHSELAKNLNWFVGPGVGLGIGDPFTLAIRVPIGLQWMATKNIEVFGQLAPAFQVIDATDFKLGGAVGVRYVF